MLENIKIVPIIDVGIEKTVALWNIVFKDAYLNSFFPTDTIVGQKNLFSGIDKCASFAAVKDREIVGAVLSFSDSKNENDSWWHTMFPGWIGSLFVKESCRRSGIAKQLLATAEEAHKKKGRMLLLAGGGEGANNLFPGIEEGWSAGRSLLESAGYTSVRTTCYVELDLKRWVEPDVISNKREALEKENIKIIPMTKDLSSAYLDYASSSSGDAGFSKLPEKLSGIFVAMNGKEVIGEVHGISLGSKGNGVFSGIHVLDKYRNQGIGKLLLVAAILYSRELGGNIMQLWTRPMTANRFYVPIGFRIAMNYEVLGKTLPQDMLSEEWIARFRHL